LTITALDRASAAFVGPGNQHDNYSEPINAPVSWWKEVATKAVEEVMIWGGGGEVLIDGIRTFGSNVVEGFSQAKETTPKKATDTAQQLNENSKNTSSTEPLKEDPNEIAPKVEATSEKNPVTETNGADAATQKKESEDNDQLNSKSNGIQQKSGTERAKLIITPKEAHEEMIMDYVLLISKKGQGAKEIENWLTATLVDSTPTTA
jgi:hypothetical protein